MRMRIVLLLAVKLVASQSSESRADVYIRDNDTKQIHVEKKKCIEIGDKKQHCKLINLRR